MRHRVPSGSARALPYVGYEDTVVKYKDGGVRCVPEFYETVITPIIAFFHIRSVHSAIIKVFYSPTNAQVIVLKTILKFTL